MNDKHRITADHATKIQQWFVDRGGIAVWSSVNMSNPGASWTTPATNSTGGPPEKPTWQAGSTPHIITNPMDVDVITPRLVKRFRVGVRMGSQGMMLKVTDGGTRRIRAACAKAGDESWHEFDYSTQEALIFVPGAIVPLMEWRAL